MTTINQANIPKEWYYHDYDKLSSFISYYYQVNLFRELQCRRLLEVGIGNKTISRYLKSHGYDVTTCDYNENLKPDHVADIRELPFDDNSYDAIMACEILEHLPWNDVPIALSELKRVARRCVIISLPVISFYLEFVFKFPLVNQIFKIPHMDIFFSLPLVTFKMRPKHHEWEIGARNYPIRKIRKAVSNYFRIVKEVRPVLNPRHRFFVLEKMP